MDNPSIAELCERFGHLIPVESAENTFLQIAPGRVRKVYRASPAKECLVLFPPLLHVDKNPRPLEEITGQRDNRAPEQLLDEVESAIRQLLGRAFCGDQIALATLVTAINHSVEALEVLANAAPQIVRVAAETLPRWPVRLSLNPQEIEHVKKDLKSLGVGTKSLTPTGPGQRRDPRNLWTRIADEAYSTCRRCKHDVPLLEALCSGVDGKHQIFEYWSTRSDFTDYLPQNAPPVRIWDWHRQCKHLTVPIINANFHAWWKVIKVSVLQYWQCSKGNYQEALDAVGQKSQKEWKRRELGLARVKQALRSLIDP
jgi:hypothetical protein